jgi:hypothetical protein
VCYVVGQRGSISLESFSYPIDIPIEWYEQWRASGIIEHPLGFTTTFGDFICDKFEDCDSKNWMAHQALGGHNRDLQVGDVLLNLLGKFMIEDKISYYANFPKEGVTFKDLSIVIGDAELLKILVSPL